MTVYTTSIENIVQPTWLPLGDVQVTAEPPRDLATGGYARLGYAATVAWLNSIGARLPTRAEMIALRDAGTRLEPVILPDAAQRAAAGITAARYPGNKAFQDATQVLREANMDGADWCAYHDARVAEQLAAMTDRDMSTPLFNIGKQWIAGPHGELAPEHTAWLMGWWMNGAWVQTGITADAVPIQRGFHDDKYTDYSSIIVGIRD